MHCRWLQTELRTNRGLVTPYAFLDMSLEATKSGVREEDTWFETFTNFTRPFAPLSWCVFVALSLVTGLCYFLLESRQNTDDVDEHAGLVSRVLTCVYLSLMQPTGGGAS